MPNAQDLSIITDLHFFCNIFYHLELYLIIFLVPKNNNFLLTIKQRAQGQKIVMRKDWVNLMEQRTQDLLIWSVGLYSPNYSDLI
ncbi:hypothetical protein ACFORL_10105 [Legionella dresdenensis]|uniref:Uncharacterized protein n=1 Tax=Legionella dresdenensis TaxID=450200 RepID=A0ABV8CGN6_9GAMM